MNFLKKIIRLSLVLASFVALTPVTALAGDVWVSGYYRSNGTYVSGHYRSAPNETRCDNWTTSGNYNPHTGSMGTRIYPECTGPRCYAGSTTFYGEKNNYLYPRSRR